MLPMPTVVFMLADDQNIQANGRYGNWINPTIAVGRQQRPSY